MAGRRPLPSAPQHRAVLPRCLWPADRHIPRPTRVGGPCKKKGCASGLRDSGQAGSPCGLGGGPRRFVLPPRGAHGFRQNKALSCPSGKPVPVNTGVREGHAVKASPWGGVLVRCVACTPSWAVCARGGLPMPWPCRWNVRHAGQTPSPRAPASTAAQSCPCPASASPPSTRFYSRRRVCPAAATRGHRLGCQAPPAAPSLTWLPWPVCVRGCCSIWGPMPSVGVSSPSPAVFLLLQGLTGPGGPAGSRLSRQVGRRSLLCWSHAGMSRGPWVART